MNNKFKKVTAVFASMAMFISLIPPGSIAYAATGDFQFTIYANTGTAILTEEECGSNCQGHTITQNTSSTLSNKRITIESGNHNVTFSELSLKLSTVEIMPGATLNLTIIGENSINDGGVHQAPIYVPVGAKLVITEQSTGSLNVSANGSAAGIGGAYYTSGNTNDQNCGTVEIHGGNITASSGDGSPAIGGSRSSKASGNGGNIIITGGKVTVNGGKNAPDIGGAYGAKSNGSLTISSPDVLDENTTLSSDGDYYITTAPTADMISVPTDLKYMSADMTAEIAERVSLSGYETVCGQKFQVYTDGWTLNVEKVSDFEYTASYTHADKGTISKTVKLPEYADGIGERLAGYTLSLSGSIGVNFCMEFDKSVLADNGAYMLFKLPNGTESKVMVNDSNPFEMNGKEYYVFLCGVCAKEMDDEITAQIVLSDGTTGTEYSYTVREYAEYIMNHPDQYGEYEFEVARTMLKYGEYAKAYFNGKTLEADDELNALAFDDAPYDVVEKYGYANYPEEIKYYGTSLILESDIVLRHYFKVEKEEYKSFFEGNKEDYCYIDRHVNIYDVYTEMKSGYGSRAINSENTSESLKNLCKALYLFSEKCIMS